MAPSKRIQDVARDLLHKSKGLTERDFGYRAYLRSMANGESGDFLLKQLSGDKQKGAKEAKEALIEEAKSRYGFTKKAGIISVEYSGGPIGWILTAKEEIGNFTNVRDIQESEKRVISRSLGAAKGLLSYLNGIKYSGAPKAEIEWIPHFANVVAEKNTIFTDSSTSVVIKVESRTELKETSELIEEYFKDAGFKKTK